MQPLLVEAARLNGEKGARCLHDALVLRFHKPHALKSKRFKALESWNASTNRWTHRLQRQHGHLLACRGRNVRLRSGEVKAIRPENLEEAPWPLDNFSGGDVFWQISTSSNGGQLYRQVAGGYGSQKAGQDRDVQDVVAARYVCVTFGSVKPATCLNTLFMPLTAAHTRNGERSRFLQLATRECLPTYLPGLCS